MGQGYNLTVTIPADAAAPGAAIRAAFIAAHREVYGHTRDAPVRLVDLRVIQRARQDGAVAISRRRRAGDGRAWPMAGGAPGWARSRTPWVVPRAALPTGATLAGPRHRGADGFHPGRAARLAGQRASRPSAVAKARRMNDAMTPSDSARRVDPATIEVVRRRLEAIAEEMQGVLLRSAVSPIVREANDASASLFLPDGTVVAQSVSLPLLLGCLMPAVNRLCEAFPVGADAAGRCLSDERSVQWRNPYPGYLAAGAGLHGRRGHRLAATIMHHQDLGGLTPGSLPTTATEIFHEGLRLPALRLARGGETDAQIMRLIALNTPHAGCVRVGSERADLRLPHRRHGHGGT